MATKFKPVDEERALAAGFTPEEIKAENGKRAREASKKDSDEWAKQVRSSAAGDNFVMDAVAGVGQKMADWGLGARQLAAQAGFGDKEALAAEAAEKARIDAPLLDTAGGMVGSTGLDIAAQMIPAGRLAKVSTKLLPSMTGLTARLARATAPSAVTGAATGVLTPGEDYDALGQAAEGAAYGAGGDIVGRGVGRVIAPRLAQAGAKTKQWVDDLREAGILPKPTLVNMTESPMARQASDALSKIPWFGSELNAAQAANRAGLTRFKTGLSGQAMEATHDLTPITRALEAEAKQFRTGQPIALGHIPARLLPIQAEAAEAVATGFGNKSVLNRTETAIRDVMTTPKYSANKVMDIRQKLSDLAYNAQGAERLKYKELQKIYEDGLRKQFGSKFDDWKSKWGHHKETLRTVEKKGVDEGQRLRASSLQREVEGTADAPRGTSQYLTRAASDRIPDPVGQENRALLTFLLLGAGVGGLGSYAGDKDLVEAGKNAVLGAGITAGFGKGAGKLFGTEGGAKYIMGEHGFQSQAKRDFLRRLLAAVSAEQGTR